MSLNADKGNILPLEQVQNILKELMREVDTFCRKRDINYYIIGGTLLGAVRHNGFIPWDDDIDIGMIREDYEKFLSVASEFSDAYEVKNYHNFNHCDYVITRIYIPNTYIDKATIRNTKLDKRLYFDIFPLDKTPEKVEDMQKHAKAIKKLRSKVILSIPFEYSKNKLKRFARKIISFPLAPFRTLLLNRLDCIMQKYNNSSSNKICSMASQYSYNKQAMEYEIYGTPAEYDFEGLSLLGPANAQEYLTRLYGEDYMELPPVEKRRKGFDIYIKD